VTSAPEQTLTCPECGLPADRHTELIPVERLIVDQGEDRITIQGLISEMQYELPERQEFLCPNGHTFPIPPGLDVSYV
jgi:hypothetical protein